MVAGIGSRVVALLMLGVPVAAQEPLAEVKVTQRYLEPVCLDGAAIKPGERSWRLGLGPHSMALTMRNAPRPGIEPHQAVDAEGGPGVASISFTVEASHRYEVEARAPAAAFSWRVWKRGEWKPVVCDRTADLVISGEPQWSDSGCPR